MYDWLQPIMSILFLTIWLFAAHITVGDRIESSADIESDGDIDSTKF